MVGNGEETTGDDSKVCTARMLKIYNVINNNVGQRVFSSFRACRYQVNNAKKRECPSLYDEYFIVLDSER